MAIFFKYSNSPRSSCRDWSTCQTNARLHTNSTGDTYNTALCRSNSICLPLLQLHLYSIDGKTWWIINCQSKTHLSTRIQITKIFKDAASTYIQTLLFFGVNDHHQNGKAENCTKDDITGARKSLLHIACRWTEYICSVIASRTQELY